MPKRILIINTGGTLSSVKELQGACAGNEQWRYAGGTAYGFQKSGAGNRGFLLT